MSHDARVEPEAGTTVSVCVPARNEAATIGVVVAAAVELLDEGVVHEVLVVDDGSSDDTAAEARAAGARVVAVSDVLPELGSATGKGEAMWKSLAASSGDIVVWCDADVTNFEASFITRLVGPLLGGAADFAKATYERPLDGRPGEGGRVTQLLARPAIALLFPALAGFAQPLAGELAGRRPLLETLPFVQGYGVDLGLLIDVWRTIGLDGMAQVDLGTRIHRNRPLDELSSQAEEVLAVALDRAGVPGVGAPPSRPPLGSLSQR